MTKPTYQSQKTKDALGILSAGGYFKSCIETYTCEGKKHKMRLYDKDGKKDKRFGFNSFKLLLPILVTTSNQPIGRRYVTL
ncbi:MAG: hypothetical protein EBT78_08135 [Betaproteobacteria bacterium]|nr:hypothetical protein [Betaproteobacteria bacterium]